jgi:hypothetical protein
MLVIAYDVPNAAIPKILVSHDLPDLIEIDSGYQARQIA